MDLRPATQAGPRLRFIDMARAVAILLMLEGHFVHLTLAPEWRVPGQLIYDTWRHLRGLAAPMFFTVTGLIFSYLLSRASPDEPFWKIHRVRRGLVRVVELMVWGYLLQLDLRQLPEAYPFARDSWVLSFHVLQCIGVGLVLMITVFGLFRRFSPWVRVSVFATAGFSMFLVSILLANTEGPLPADAPVLIQNMIKGPRSNFPLSPWLGFTFYGAAIGVIARHRQVTRGRLIHPLWLLVAGYLLAQMGWSMDGRIGHGLLAMIDHGASPRVTPCYFHGRFGEILVMLGLLVAFEKYIPVRTGRFETIGRNTFSIYAGHVIVLYGGLFGVGLQGLRHALNPWQAATGALLFMTLFAGLAQCVDPLKQRWRSWRSRQGRQ